MMLNYLEQAPLYNAINFNMEGRGSDYASSANATAYNAKISLFLCPSDPDAGRINDNCYYGSVGPTTNAGSDTPPRPTNPTCPYYSSATSGVLRSVWLMASRTSPTGRRTRLRSPKARRGPRFRSSHRATWSWARGCRAMLISWRVSKPGAVVADLQTCSRQYVASNSGNISVGHGHDWGVGGMGATLFNTVAPPQ